jgi:aldehyde dehydrogenase (NAD+)
VEYVENQHDHCLLDLSLQIKQLKSTIEEFYGEDPSTSKDLSRIVNRNHFQRLSSLLDDPSTAEKIVSGGERDEKTL